jgi:hypothetical protein
MLLVFITKWRQKCLHSDVLKTEYMTLSQTVNSMSTMSTPSYLCKQGYAIDRLAVPFSVLKELTVTPLVDSKYSNGFAKSFKTFSCTGSKVYLPKAYAIRKFGAPRVTLSSYKGVCTPLEFTGKLRSDQLEPAMSLYNAVTGPLGGGILCLGTGQGKTVTCIEVLCRLGMKSMIVVNKISLLDQWISEFATFVPRAKVGVLQGKKVPDSDCNIVIATLQSLALKDYPPALFSEFGAVVFDECHNVSSQAFSRALQKTCSQYTIGLSATPTRSDGCERVFEMWLGDIVKYAPPTPEKGLAPVIQTWLLAFDGYTAPTGANGTLQFAGMINSLVKMECRNAFIAKLVLNFAADPRRKVLVLSDRRDHLKTLQSLIPGAGVFVGGMKIADLNKARQQQIILATYQAFGEGVSERDLNTLVLATPKKWIGDRVDDGGKKDSGRLEQYIGRIFRKVHNQVPPIVCDLQDRFSVYTAQSRQRMAFYRKEASRSGSSLFGALFESKSPDLVCESKGENQDLDSDFDTVRFATECVIED